MSKTTAFQTNSPIVFALSRDRVIALSGEPSLNLASIFIEFSFRTIQSRFVFTSLIDSKSN